jgi:hypothetical protein
MESTKMANPMLKHVVNDKVTYIGNEESVHGISGTILRTREHREVENDIERGATLYPKDGYDYTLEFARSGMTTFVLDVMEDEIQ